MCSPTACPRQRRGQLLQHLLIQPPQMGKLTFMCSPLSLFVVWSASQQRYCVLLHYPPNSQRVSSRLQFTALLLLNVCFFLCFSKGESSKSVNDSPSGSVSETPKKSSKKSKKNTESMTKVYTSVLNSVFGAVSSWHTHLITRICTVLNKWTFDVCCNVLFELNQDWET